MKLLQTKINNTRFEHDLLIETFASEVIPDQELITTGYAFIFQDKKLLLVSHDEGRGWEIPGGHIEENENVIEATCRETNEESGFIVSDLVCFAHQKITIQGEKPENGKYPYPVSYQTYFLAKNYRFDPYTKAEFEHCFFDSKEGQEADFIKNHNELYQYALGLL